MDGFLKEDFVGTVRKGMTMGQIDNMVERQLKMMQQDYDLCQKFEDPNYQGEPLVLQGKFEQKEFEDGTQFKDDKEVETKNKKAEPEQIEQDDGSEKKEEMIKKEVPSQDKQDGSDEEEDDNRCVEDYYQPLDNDGNDDDEVDDEDNEQWKNFEQAEDFKDLPADKDPRKKEIDVEKIKQIMSSFTLKPPSWASDKKVWETKVEGLIKEMAL